MNGAPETLYESTIKSLPLIHRGKVRDIYPLSGERLLLITTDRLSAFDHVLGSAPYKGQVLNQLSAFWFLSRTVCHL